MKSSKGFTLIELMTTIVVLSIVMVIAYSVIKNNIDASRKETFKVSIKNVMDAAKEYVVTNFSENDFPNGGISVTDLELKNNKITSGIIMKNEEDIIEVVNMSDGNYCANGSKNNLDIKSGSCANYDETNPTIDAIVKNAGMDYIMILVKMTIVT